jgi:hypothetical protein
VLEFDIHINQLTISLFESAFEILILELSIKGLIDAYKLGKNKKNKKEINNALAK